MQINVRADGTQAVAWEKGFARVSMCQVVFASELPSHTYLGSVHLVEK